MVGLVAEKFTKLMVNGGIPQLTHSKGLQRALTPQPLGHCGLQTGLRCCLHRIWGGRDLQAHSRAARAGTGTTEGLETGMGWQRGRTARWRRGSERSSRAAQREIAEIAQKCLLLSCPAKA